MNGLEPVKRMTYTLIEAATMLGINRSTAYRLAAEGQFPVPVIRIGKAVRIPAPALDALLQGATAEPVSESCSA